jgi:hypothetical protein
MITLSRIALAALAWSPDAARVVYATPRKPAKVEQKDAMVS